MQFVLRSVAIGSLAFLGMACSGDETVKNDSSTTGGFTIETICDANAGLTDVASSMCPTLLDDYAPRDAASTNDSWPSCVSDSNQYVPFSASNAATAYAEAFQQISGLLGFGGLSSPSPAVFGAARGIYEQPGGIAVRVAELEDSHYPAAPKPCRDMLPEEQAQYPFRCAGFVRIRSILEIAFDAGMKGGDPSYNVARIEAALLWFLYQSTYEEAVRAAENAAAVDTSWASYSGGEPRENAIALAKYVRERSTETHDRIWDGLLALRCWRDLDNPQGVAMDAALQSRAVTQLDRALLRGIALILRQRVQLLSCAPAWESAEILGGILLREAEARDPEWATVFTDEISRRGAILVNQEKLIQAIDVLFPCP